MATGTKNILGLVAVAIGGYILYKKATEPDWDISNLFSLDALFGTDADGEIAPTVNQAGQPTTTVPEAATPVTITAPETVLDLTLLQQTLAIAKKALPLNWDGKLTSDEWNYYYKIASGVEQTTDLFLPGLRSERITIDEYSARRAAKGLTGLGASRFRNIPGIIRSGGASSYELAAKRRIS